MRKFTQVVSLVLTAGLLSQPMLFAQETLYEPSFPIRSLQTQAQQDLETIKGYSELYRFIAAGAGISAILFLGAALAEKTYAREAQEELTAALAENAALKEQVAKGNKLQDKLRKENKQIKGELDETRYLYLQSESKQLDWRQAQARASRQNGQRAINADLFVEKSGQFGPLPAVNLEKYTAIYDASVPANTRWALRNELTAEPWFKALSQPEQKEFLQVIDQLYKAPIAQADTKVVLQSTYPIMQRFMSKHMSSASQHMMALYRGFFKKGNVLLAAFLICSAASASAAQRQAASARKANRIENNPALFVNANEQQLEQIQQDPLLLQTCSEQARMLHILSSYPPEVLETLSKLLGKQARSQQLQRATQTQTAR